MKRLPARAWFLLRRGGESLNDAAGTRDAAQVAFYVLLSLPAALLLAVWGSSALLGDPNIRQDIVDAAVDAFPLEDQGRADVERILNRVAAGAGALGIVAIAGIVYSASGAMASLRHAVNVAFNGGPDRRPFFQGKALDVGLTLVTVPAVALALTLNLAGPLPSVLGEDPLVRGTAGLVVTQLIPGVIVFGLLLGLYRILPSRSVGINAVWPGALAALVALVLVRVGAAAYFEVSGGAGAVYGTIGAILVIAFSIQLNATAIIYGAHVAAVTLKTPDGEAIDREIERSRGPSQPLRETLGGAVRGLFVRRRSE